MIRFIAGFICGVLSLGLVALALSFFLAPVDSGKDARS